MSAGQSKREYPAYSCLYASSEQDLKTNYQLQYSKRKEEGGKSLACQLTKDQHMTCFLAATYTSSNTTQSTE